MQNAAATLSPLPSATAQGGATGASHATSTLPPVQPQIVALHPGFVSMYEDGLTRSQMSEHEWRRPRFFHMTQLLRLTAGIPGATAEAGVFRGLGSYLMCRVLREESGAFDGSGHFMIDSFEGLPPGRDDDGPTATVGRFNNTSVEHVRGALSEFPNVKIVKGWIPSAFTELPQTTYRFVHVDVDLHDSTLDSLEYFYPRMSPGGIIVVDDYGPWPTGVWPGCAKAVRAFCSRMGIGHTSLDTGNAVIVKRA